MIDVLFGYKVINKNYELVESKLKYYLKMFRNIQIMVIRGDKEALLEGIEAETKRNNILIYEDVFEKLYPQNNMQALAQTISHEFWHIFSARFKFYSRLEKILLENKKINRLTRKDVEKFIKKLNSLSQEQADKMIKAFQESVPCWTDEYIMEQARYDSKKKFFNRIDYFRLRGIIDEIFAERYAEWISRIENKSVPKFFTLILKKILD